MEFGQCVRYSILQNSNEQTYLETVIYVLCATLGEAQIQQTDFIKDFRLHKTGKRERKKTLD